MQADKFAKAINNLSVNEDSDVYLFSATINDFTVDTLILEFRKVTKRRKNCILILTTYGGDPDAGYRMVRAIREFYLKFALFIFGSCKSTGTLVALGADEIVMGDFGEFGPLDIQLAKDDELTNTSGLSYLQSLISLNERIFSSFEENFMSLKRKVRAITTKTAAEIGSKLAIGIIEPIAGQIDPLKLGETQRAIKIAQAYGERICKDKDLVKKLISDYPSHSFVIDFNEAKELFKGKKIRRPDETEFIIETEIFKIVRSEAIDDTIMFLFSKDDTNDEGDTDVDNMIDDENESPINDNSNENEDI